MLAIDLNGVQALVSLLEDIHVGDVPDDRTLEAVLAANAFFVGFYSGWEGCSREIIARAIRHFNQPDQVPEGVIPGRLAEGFRKAIAEIDLMRTRMAWLAEIDASNIAERILSILPDGTPLESTIHITVDFFNNAFAYKGEMGVSLLQGAADHKAFETVVMHELHHVGFRYWADRDADRQRLLCEKTGRSVAVMHVENLLMEGMANYYCSAEYVFGMSSTPSMDDDPYQTRLARLQREEKAFFIQAEAVLAACLKPEAEYETCWEAFKTIAFDMEDMMLPAGHYLGACMIQTAAQTYARSRIVGWIQRLQEFLPAYNEAARASGGFVFSKSLVEQFSEMFGITGNT